MNVNKLFQIILDENIKPLFNYICREKTFVFAPCVSVYYHTTILTLAAKLKRLGLVLANLNYPHIIITTILRRDSVTKASQFKCDKQARSNVSVINGNYSVLATVVMSMILK